MDQNLCETSITGHQIEKYLLGALAKGSNGHKGRVNGLRLVSVDAQPMGIQGYISKVLQITLTWNDKGMAEAVSAPETVIVKCPTSVNLQRMLDTIFETADGQGKAPDASLRIREYHNDEIGTYDFLFSGGKEHELVGIPVPRYFGAALIEDGQPCSQGVLIMEDMSKHGKVMKTVSPNLSLAQVISLTESLANLHAWSYIRWSKEGKGHDDQVPSIQDRLDRWQELFCSITPAMIRQLEIEYPDIFANIPEQKALDLFGLESFLKLFGLHAHDDKLPVVLVHGDVQPMNILYSKQDDARVVGLIDWQMSHRGYGPEDLARLLAVCSKNELKRAHGDEILRRYVEVFNARIQGTSLKPILFENVKYVFTRMYSYMAMMFAQTARIADQFVEAVEDKEERKKVKEEYIQHCASLYRDASEILGW